MNPQNIRCAKHNMINNDKVELDSALAHRLVTSLKGLLAGGTSEKDLIDCPKMGQPMYEVCKDCEFSLEVNTAFDGGFGV